MSRILIFHIVCFAWIYFRAPTIGAAHRWMSGAFHWSWAPVYGSAVVFLIVFSLPLFLLDLRQYAKDEEYPFARSKIPIRVAVGLVSLLLVMLFGASSSSAFIYFQF